MRNNDHASTGRFISFLSKNGGILAKGAASVIDAVKQLPEVHKLPSFFQLGNEPSVDLDGSLREGGTRFVEAPGSYLTVRFPGNGQPRALGHVGEQYQVIPDADAFGFVQAMHEEGKVEPLAVGESNGGARHWLLCTLPGKGFDAGPGDTMAPLFLTENSHDGSASMRWSVFLLRLVCTNGMVRREKVLSQAIRHTANANERVAEAFRVLSRIDEGLDALKAEIQAMQRRKLTKTERAQFIAAALGIDLTKDLSTRATNILAKVAEVFEAGRGVAAGNKDTLWHAYNTITEYVNHERTVKGDEGRINSVWFGSGSVVMARATELAKSLVVA